MAKKVRPILENTETGLIISNCSLAYIAGMIGKVPITLQRWAKDYEAGKFKKKQYGCWIIHFDAKHYKQHGKN